MSFNFLFYLVKAHLLLFSPLQALSVDCPNVVNLAQGIGMESIQPSIWTSLKGDCCTVSSVTCVSQRVTQIYWYELGLNGVINGTAIPIGLTHLTLSYNWAIQGSIPSLLPVGLVKLHLIGNQITGSIPPALPSGLTDFNIYDNWVSGQIPLTLPSGLLIFQVNGNRMSGDVPLLPSTLRYLVLGFSGYSGNHFTGTIRITKPYDIHINNNWITDIIIQDISAFTVCDLSNNPLLGNPSIASLTMCTKTGLYSAGLLPNTKTTSRSITKTLTMTMTISSSSRSTTTLSSIRTTTSISTTMLRSTQITNFLTSKQTTNFVFSTSKLALKTPSISTVLLKSTTFLADENEGDSSSVSLNLEPLEVTFVNYTFTSNKQNLLKITAQSTVQFELVLPQFAINVRIIMRCSMNLIVLGLILSKTPFQREFDRLRKKKMAVYFPRSTNLL